MIRNRVIFSILKNLLMSRLIFPLCVLIFLATACNDEAQTESMGFNGIDQPAALKYYDSYADPRVPHEPATMMRAVELTKAELEDLTSKYNSVRLFIAADPGSYKPTFLIQGNTGSGFDYLVFDTQDPICPPPSNCRDLIR